MPFILFANMLHLKSLDSNTAWYMYTGVITGYDKMLILLMLEYLTIKIELEHEGQTLQQDLFLLLTQSLFTVT